MKHFSYLYCISSTHANSADLMEREENKNIKTSLPRILGVLLFIFGTLNYF